jgi:hypothetical protein
MTERLDSRDRGRDADRVGNAGAESVGAPVAAVSPPTQSSTWPYESFDAREWAAAFLEIHPQCGVAHEVLVGWFANALMRGYDEHAAISRRSSSPR